MKDKEYDKHMNVLALKIAKELDGQPPFDVAAACMAVAGFVNRDNFDDEEFKKEQFDRMVDFLHYVALETKETLE